MASELNFSNAYLIIQCEASEKRPDDYYAIVHIYTLFTTIPDCLDYFKNVKPNIKKEGYYNLSFFDYNTIFVAIDKQEAKKLGVGSQGYGILNSTLNNRLHRKYEIEHNKLYISDLGFYWKGYLKNSNTLLTTVRIDFNEMKKLMLDQLEWRPDDLLPEDISQDSS